jgi:hypothetical protein
MKITLVLILLNYTSFSYTPTSTSMSTSSTATSSICTGSAMTPMPAKVSIPMPDLKSCLEARHQIDGYTMLASAACSAE